MRTLIIAAVAATFGAGCVHHYHSGPTEYREVRQVEYVYAGAHPMHGSSGWCLVEHQHNHDYAPDYSYYNYDGSSYAYSGPTLVWYFGYHPIPAGGHCNINGRHNHRYHPGYAYADSYDWDSGQNGYVYRRPGQHGASAVRPPPGQGTGYAPPGYTQNNPPGQGYNPPPGHGGTPPGHGGTPPGHNQGNTPPGHINNPGNVARPPVGNGNGNAYGHRPPPAQNQNQNQGYNPPPGHGGTPPGQGGTPPGHNVGNTPPGHLNNPGHGGRPGGWAPPGQQQQTIPAAGNPGQGNGQGQVNAPPGRPGGSGRPAFDRQPGQLGNGNAGNNNPGNNNPGNNHGRPQAQPPQGNRPGGVQGPGNHQPNHKVDLPPGPPGRFAPPGNAPQKKEDKKPNGNGASQPQQAPNQGPARPAPGRPPGPPGGRPGRG